MASSIWSLIQIFGKTEWTINCLKWAIRVHIFAKKVGENKTARDKHAHLQKKKEKKKNMISISSNKVWLWWHGYWRVFNCNMWFHWKKSCCPCLMHIHENESIFPLYLWMVTEESSVVAEAVSRLTFSLTERLPYNYELGNTHTVSLFTFTFIDDNCSVNHISNEGGCLVHKLVA